MRRIRILTALLLSLFLSLSLCGCNIIYSIIDSGAIAEAEAIPKVGFCNEEMSDESEEIIMSESELNATERIADDYRSDFHFSLLNDNEKLAYTALEYALEKGYRYVYIDKLLIESEDALGKIIDYLALDSPLLEQNLSYQLGNFTTYYDVKLSQATLKGVYVEVDNFTEAAFSKKLEAVEKAKKIVADMPKELDEVEKARYLHGYTVSNVIYTDYENGYKAGEDVCLYDGLVKGKTHCDGSNNMLALLFNLAGLKSFEKVHTEVDADGHTWNTVNLNGLWYNCDATALGKDDDEELEVYKRRFFAFEDLMQNYLPDYAEIYPKCEVSLGIKINARLESVNKNTFVKTVKDAFKTNGERLALILIDKYIEEDADTAAQRLADSLSRRISYYEYEVIDDRIAMLIEA